MLHNDRLAWCGHQPVEGLQQNLEGALVREWQLAQHNGAARRALLSRLDEVRQQPALCIERVFHGEYSTISNDVEWQGACSKAACNCTGRKHIRLWGPSEVLLHHAVVLSCHSTSHEAKSWWAFSMQSSSPELLGYVAVLSSGCAWSIVLAMMDTVHALSR